MVAALALVSGAAAVWGASDSRPDGPIGTPGVSAPETSADSQASATPTANASSPSAEELFPDAEPWTGTPAIDDACTPMRQPDRRIKAWFTRPGIDGPQPLAKAVAKLICTAAPNSTVRIAMYFLKEDSPDVERIMRSLRIVAKQRNVDVQLVLDGSPYAKKTAVHVKTLERLDSIGEYYLCPYGCRSQHTQTLPNGLQSTELQHNKFVVITDTIWNTRLDPLLIQSSANWSRSQLSTRHQSGVMIADDPVLAKHFDIRWESLVECSNPEGTCAGWNDRLAELGLDPDRYGVEQHRGVWYDRDLGWLEGSDDRGLEVLFSPCCEDVDPIQTALDVYDCTTEHDTVWVGHLFITQWRPAVISSLAAAQERGCDVRIVVSSFDRPHNVVGIQKMREAGLRPRCVPKVHDKILLVDAVNRRTGQPEKTLWIGSQSFGYDALYRGDEVLLEVTDAGVAAPVTGENRGVWRQYRTQWRYLRDRVTSCPV